MCATLGTPLPRLPSHPQWGKRSRHQRAALVDACAHLWRERGKTGRGGGTDHPKAPLHCAAQAPASAQWAGRHTLATDDGEETVHHDHKLPGLRVALHGAQQHRGDRAVPRCFLSWVLFQHCSANGRSPGLTPSPGDQGRGAPHSLCRKRGSALCYCHGAGPREGLLHEGVKDPRVGDPPGRAANGEGPVPEVLAPESPHSSLAGAGAHLGPGCAAAGSSRTAGCPGCSGVAS